MKLLAEKSPQISPKYKRYLFISDSFALNWYICVVLTNKHLLLPLYLSWSLKQNSLFDLQKLIEYWASAVHVVSSNPSIGLWSIIKISLFCY